MTVRTARHSAVCGAPGCLHLIYQGAPITKPPGRAWRHADCSRPGKRSREDRAEAHALAAAKRRRDRLNNTRR